MCEKEVKPLSKHERIRLALYPRLYGQMIDELTDAVYKELFGDKDE